MKRLRTIKNIYDKKDITYAFEGIWGAVIGNPEKSGTWLVYGREKNGKTWFSVMLADYFSSMAKTLYISAEEGLSANFKATCKRANLSVSNKSLHFSEYISLSDLSAKLKKQRAHKIILLDNATIYREELKGLGLKRLLEGNKNKLFILLAHEENKEPFTAAAKLCKILSKVIVRVEGLACTVSGRCPGGRLIIDQEKAMLYHGTEVLL